jgi:hypothetical protein
MTPARPQRGAALLLLLVAVVMAFVTAVFAGLGTWGTVTTAKRNVNAEVLAHAKAALIGYVAKEVLNLSEEAPGRLPCPESVATAGTNSEGTAADNCAPAYASNKSLGRLPWRTLGADKLVDAAGEPLWYAVSPNWVPLTTGSPLINPGASGQLSFDGTTGVVAIIFAPGKALSANPTTSQVAAGCAARNQVRADRSHISTSTADPDFRDYLECDNASASIDSTFGVEITGNATNEVINDQAVVITARELLNALQGPLAERAQRTIAPLLNEYSKKWVSGGTILPTPADTTLLPHFMPYAAPFAAPESATPTQQHCGSSVTPVREGLMPVAAMALVGPCASPWGSFTWTGSVGGPSCTTDAAGTATCQFDYYTLRTIPLIGQTLFQTLGLTSPPTITVTLQATAPYAASTFRRSLSASDFTISPSINVASASFTQVPNSSDGSATVSVQFQISDTALCVDTPVLSIVCSALAAVFTTQHALTAQFPALSNPTTLQGIELSAAVMSGVTPPLNLVSPAAGQPHYWFFRNEWYRYSYYAVAPGTSAAQTGGTLTVNQFPATYGANNDKRFLLTLVGPAVTGQTRSPAATLSQYVEGDNAATTASPRVFAYQAFSASGNDRVATCPFTSGASICD